MREFKKKGRKKDFLEGGLKYGSRLFTRWLVCFTGATALILTSQSRANKSWKRQICCQEGREEERVQRGGWEQEREEQLRGKSQVTKPRHIPDKPLYHITMLHHTGYNELMLCEVCPYLHAHPSRSYLRRDKLELPHKTWTTANWRNEMQEKCGDLDDQGRRGGGKGGLFYQNWSSLVSGKREMEERKAKRESNSWREK